MAHHSKWHNIRIKKGATDKKRGKIFTRHAKLIEISAREGGGDPDMNPNLRTVIDNARADNVPNSNIERAIQKGTGELAGNSLIEAFFEGYGPGGVALYIQVVTDNRNRSVGSIKTILSKNGGAIGGPGSVAYLFERRGHLVVKCNAGGSDRAGVDIEGLQLAAIDAGASDVRIIAGDVGANSVVEIYTDASDLMKVKKKLEECGFHPEQAEITYVPKTIVPVSDSDAAKRILNLIELLEEDDDVTDVFANFDMPEEILTEIEKEGGN